MTDYGSYDPEEREYERLMEQLCTLCDKESCRLGKAVQINVYNMTCTGYHRKE